MKLITTRDKIRTVAWRWLEQHNTKGFWCSESAKDKYDRLTKLDLETCTEADVTAIIGNGFWIELGCSDCGGRGMSEVIQLGEEPDYESRTAFVCKPCIKKAYGIIEGV